MGVVAVVLGSAFIMLQQVFVMGSMIVLMVLRFEDDIHILNQRHLLEILNLWLAAAPTAVKFLLRARKERLELLLLLGKELGVVLRELFSQLSCFVEALLADIEITDKQFLQRF